MCKNVFSSFYHRELSQPIWISTIQSATKSRYFFYATSNPPRLCNRTRLQVKIMRDNVNEVGPVVGEVDFIPRLGFQ